jgi:hypothetical protein
MHADFSAASSSGVRDAAAEFCRAHSDLSPPGPPPARGEERLRLFDRNPL